MENLNRVNNCPFCDTKIQNDLIFGNETAFVIFDRFPVSKGHALIISKRHCASFFDLTSNEQNDCFSLIFKMKKEIQNKYNPDGFNIGINIGKSAGQTIFHVHIHLIPRYIGDVENPTGGVRAVIPSKKMY